MVFIEICYGGPETEALILFPPPLPSLPPPSPPVSLLIL